MSYSVHVDNKKKDISFLGEGIDGKTLTAEKNYSVDFTENNKKFCLSLHYKGASSYLFINWYVYDFSVDYDAYAVNDILSIYKKFVKKNDKCLDLLRTRL